MKRVRSRLATCRKSRAFRDHRPSAGQINGAAFTEPATAADNITVFGYSKLSLRHDGRSPTRHVPARVADEDAGVVRDVDVLAHGKHATGRPHVAPVGLDARRRIVRVRHTRSGAEQLRKRLARSPGNGDLQGDAGETRKVHELREFEILLRDYLVHSKEKVSRDTIAETSVTKRTPVTCAGAREMAVVYPTGDVADCELRDDCEVICGRMISTSVKSGKDPRRDGFAPQTGAVDACQGCYHHCFISPALFRTPKM
jgi:hypothetical protein